MLTLLQAAGHSDFRDARGPMGFNQRQAAGKFTRDEADAFIEQLETEAGEADGTATGANPAEATPPKATRAGRASAASRNDATGAGAAPEALSNTERALRKVPSTLLAAELQRRGWVVMEP